MRLSLTPLLLCHCVCAAAAAAVPLCVCVLLLQVKVKGTKGTNAFELPSAGFQRVVPVAGKDTELRVTIDLQNPKRAREPRGAHTHTQHAAPDTCALSQHSPMPLSDRCTAPLLLLLPGASEEDRNDKEYLQPSAMVDSSDEVVIALSHQVD